MAPSHVLVSFTRNTQSTLPCVSWFVMTGCSHEEPERTTHVGTCCAESRNVIVDDFYFTFLMMCSSLTVKI